MRVDPGGELGGVSLTDIADLFLDELSRDQRGVYRRLGERMGSTSRPPGRGSCRRCGEGSWCGPGALGDVAFFLSEPSGAVVWVDMGAGEDPPVQYIHEGSTEVIVWTQTFTEWLARLMPNEDGELPLWT